MPHDRRNHLRTLLQQHLPGDALERTHRDATLALLDTPGDPFSRDHFEPGHVTASAFVLSPDAGSLLLILHGKLHRWLQPGGHVDPDDLDVLAAARREVAEEVGLLEVPLSPLTSGIVDVDVHVIPARKADPEHRHFDVRFLFQARDWAFLAGSDAHAGQWVKLDDIGALESDASVLRAVAKIQALRRNSPC
jgi:8-oxo-dGTP pyrophosphatase MutT (NUDIX family)